MNSFNPIYLVFHEWIDIWHDLKYVKSPLEAFQLLFKPPGTVVTEHQRHEQQEIGEQNAEMVPQEQLLSYK